MTSVTVRLSDPAAQEFRRRAALRGVSIEEYVRDVLEAAAELPKSPNQSDPVKWEADLRAWVASLPKGEGVTMDDSRESIYEGRGE
jgi:plasmid stability protein